MATWKRVTASDKKVMEINTDQILFMEWSDNAQLTTITFVGSAMKAPLLLTVETKPADILA
jgi:hypothetical protein